MKFPLIKKIITGVALLMQLPFIVYSQKVLISNADTARINKKAITQLYQFSRLLKNINDIETEQEDVKGMIQASFSKNRIFLDSSFTVTDDINPAYHTSEAPEVPILRYLDDFNLYCKKGSLDTPVDFNIIGISSLKKSSIGFYIRIFYTEQFYCTHTQIEIPYTENTRVADFSVEYKDRKYTPYISHIGFIHPDSVVVKLNDVTNNVAILIDSSAYTQALSDLEIEEKEKERRQYKYIALINNAEHAEKTGDYAEAYLYYKQADQLNPSDPMPLRKISLISKQLEKEHKVPADYYYESFTTRAASEARRYYRYDKAIEYYQQAIQQQPAKAAQLNLAIDSLRRKYGIQQLLETKFNAQDYEGAKKGYKSALETDKNNSDLLCGLAKCYYKTGNKKEALNTFNRALEADPLNARAIQSLAVYYYETGDYANAINQYKIMKIEDKFNPDIYVRIAEVKLKQGKTSEALQDLDDAISIHPDEPGLYVKKGQVLFEARNYKEANENFKKAIGKNQFTAEAWLGQGKCYIALNDANNAVKSFNEARSMGLGDNGMQEIDAIADQFFNRYNTNIAAYKTYANTVNLDSARHLIDLTIRISPENPLYRLERGDLSVLASDYEHAVKCYTEAIGINPSYTEAYINRGKTNIALGHYDIAIKDFDQALSLLPPVKGNKGGSTSYYNALQGRADAYFYGRQYREAVGQYLELLNALKENKSSFSNSAKAQLMSNLGRAYYETGDDDKAMEQLKEAISTDKNQADAYHNRGLLHFKKGRKTDAMDDLKRSLALDNTNAGWYYDLGYVALQTSRKPDEYKYAADAFDFAVGYDTEHKFPMAMYYAGYCNYVLGNYPVALQRYQAVQTMGIDKELPDYNVELGYIYANVGKLDSALQVFNRAYQNNQLDAAACFGLGVVTYIKNPADADAYYSWFDKAFQRKKLDKDFVKKNPPLINDLKNEKRYKELVDKYY